jgi:cytochrome P450
MRIIRDPSLVSAILRDPAWEMAGPICRALGPLLGEGLILATGAAHTEQRRQLGGAMRKIEGVAEAVAAYLPPEGPCDLGQEMQRLVEGVVMRALLGTTAPTQIAPLVRRCVQLAPLRLLGLPIDWPWLRQLNRELAALPAPAWMPRGLSPKQRRDWLATFVVAGIDTTSSDATAQLVGVPLLPIWWLPRRHATTGELVVLMLSPGHKFGGGVRKCVGEPVAREIVQLVLERFRVQVLPGSDLRPTGLLTRRLRRVRALILPR